MGEDKPAATAKKNLGGRPPIVFGEKEFSQLESMIGYGLTLEQAAAVMGISTKSLKRIISKRRKALGFDPLEHARAKVIGNLASSGYRQSLGYKKTAIIDGKAVEIDVPPNGQMTRYMLNVLGGQKFVERRQVDLDTPDGKPFELVIKDYRTKKE